MNAHVSLQHIELAKLMAVLNRTALSIVELSNNNTAAVFDGQTINIIYDGRGSESIGLFLSNAYPVESRIKYMTENLNRLNEIKKDLLEEAA